MTACHPSALQSAAAAFLNCCYSSNYKVLCVPPSSTSATSSGTYVSLAEACLLPKANAPKDTVVAAARRAGLLVPDLPVDILKASLLLLPCVFTQPLVLLLMSCCMLFTIYMLGVVYSSSSPALCTCKCVADATGIVGQTHLCTWPRNCLPTL